MAGIYRLTTEGQPVPWPLPSMRRSLIGDSQRQVRHRLPPEQRVASYENADVSEGGAERSLGARDDGGRRIRSRTNAIQATSRRPTLALTGPVPYVSARFWTASGGNLVAWKASVRAAQNLTLEWCRRPSWCSCRLPHAGADRRQRSSLQSTCGA